MQACEKWASKGTKRAYLGYNPDKYYGLMRREKEPLVAEARSCVREDQTNQILGYENPAIVRGKWDVDNKDAWDKEVVKHFRY